MQYVVADESLDLPGSRGTANYIQKCKLCGRMNSLNIVKESFKPYLIEKNEEYQPIIQFDCRGVEPVEFEPMKDWCAEGVESNTMFDNIDLTEKEWADYDEKVNDVTMISEIESRFVLSKK
ncbi:hypothetical protein AB6A40_010284 [Gnathostoma spinigerum]|uniref:CXXC motif containing zinc binding protein n=1 Tax=Gnathostoma spinigerum TaxID=75299 RepID=A0ABD6EVQ3_9BILA